MKAVVPTEQVVDVRSDVCGESLMKAEQMNYATLPANWGYGSRHDGERYQVDLCESCFFEALANLRQSHRQINMFADVYEPVDPERFGRVD
ncbi:hypothetical protein [Aeromonas hydrophila]|uniref:hypothetical protein n=1 Tax=Aeromonas hydrophila TaxID=644 RepID=UPI001F5C45E0|nr:hypothetical protein [Aeromonas hydrophila]UMQ35973.1 hypothetical protein MJ578_12335 [Aeromonas hydrophila]UMQ44507.1 hypothetical protein MJ573_12340 [Aeromonas hydrophila]